MGNTTASLTHEQLFGGGVTSSGARFVDPAIIQRTGLSVIR